MKRSSQDSAVVGLAFVALSLGALSLGVVSLGACSVGELDLEQRGCPCGAGYVCDVPRDLCVRPGAIAPTPNAGDAGDDGSGPCRGPDCPCTTAPDSCSVGSYCLPTSKQCVPGCKANTECAALSPTAPFCNTQRHQCVECNTTTDCKDAKQCSPAGACVTTCPTEGAPCADGKSTCCKGLCIDTQSDVLNCNGCGTVCTGASTLCCAGQCADPLTSAAHCGRCGAACNSTKNATAASCAAGACAFACTAGFGHCTPGNTGCETSTASNPVACGSCANNCNVRVLNASGISCQGSTCGFAACNAGFTNLDGNATNGCEACGKRGQECCPGNICDQGTQCEPKPANDGKCH